MKHDRRATADLPPVDRFGAWLDRKLDARPWTDPHRFWSGLIAVAIAVPGVLLAERDDRWRWMGAVVILAASGVFGVLLWRYHPAYRRRTR